jgi:hypothetical protein
MSTRLKIIRIRKGVPWTVAELKQPGKTPDSVLACRNSSLWPSRKAMPDILLTTLNAKSRHAAFGLRRVNGCHSVAGICFDRGDNLPHR